MTQSNTVAPNQRGLVRLTIVPPDLRAAFDRMLQISRLADDCCRTPGSVCDGRTRSQSCNELKSVFERLDPDGRFDLHVESDQPGTVSEVLIRYRPFARFDGDALAGVSSHALPFHSTAVYPLTMRGVLELVDDNGDVAASEAFAAPVGLCATCDEATASTSVCHGRE